MWKVVEDSVNLYFDQLNMAEGQLPDTIVQGKEKDPCRS